MNTFPILRYNATPAGRAKIEQQLLQRDYGVGPAFFQGTDEEVAERIKSRLLSATHTAATSPAAHTFLLSEITEIGNLLRACGSERWENVTRKVELYGEQNPDVIHHYWRLGQAPLP